MVSASEVSEWLSGTLNPNPNIRMTAELKLSALSSNPDTSLALSEIIVSQDADMALRQMSFSRSAIILLRKYVREHWSPYFQNFQGNAPPVEVKDQVRRAVFQGLSDPNRRIRSLCASVIKFIANCDWPDEYPDLLDNLISLISSGSLDSVHGAMQVFTEFIKADLSEDQILPVLRDLLPVMHRILGESQQSPFTRARTISVFRQCTISLYTVKEQYSTAVKEASTVILPAWLEAFKVLLSEDPNNCISPDNWDLLAIRVQIFKSLETVHTSFPRALAPYLPNFLDLAVFHLNSLYQAFERFYLTNTDQPPSSSDEEEAVHLSNLISSILDFIANTVRGGRAKAWFTKEHSQELIACVFRYAQMTVDDEESWAENANSFVAQEDDETQDYSVRIAGFDLLASLMERNDVQSTTIFQAVIRHVIETSDQARNSGNDHWWKPLEGALSCVGSQAEAIAECISDEAESGRSAPIDVEYLLKDVVPTVLGLQEHPFLQGRGFVFASQYSELLPGQLAGHYFDAAVNVIESNEGSIPVKISAVRAVHNFCKSENTEALVPYMARIAKDMGPFILHTSEDTLSLVLETLSVIVSVDKAKWITPELAHDLVQAVLQVWASNVKDPILLSIFPDILESLASADAPGVYEVVAKVALPSLCESLANTTEPWATASAIELINALISADHPMGEGFFAVLAPALFKSLATVEDRDALQNGIVALTLVVRKDCNQLLNWADETGRSGLDYVLTLVAKLLQGEDESAGLTIGDLIIHLLRRAGDAVVPVLPELLRAMVNRMTSAKTASFVQSLIIPFAFLITAQRDTVLSLLETTDVQGRSGLDILIHTWCENAETFQGFWASRVSTLALSQLFICERPSLQNLTVKGDLIVKEETRNVIMTRSRTKNTPTEFTSVTFPVKALKILIHDLTANGESATIAAAVPEDFPDDDEDKDWSDEEGPSTKTQQELQFLSDLIGPKGLAFDNDDILEQTEDEDLKNDPISQLNLQEHISTFFKECASRNTGGFSSLVQQLKPEEINVVQAVVQQ